MKKYDYAVMGYSIEPFYLTFGATDSLLVQEIISDLQLHFPKFKIDATTNKQSGEICYFNTFKRFDNGNADWWIIEQLCKKGWEPFALDNGLHFKYEHES